jgi:hypothetical protein
MNFLSPIKDRDHLRDVCVTAQYNICVVCGKGLYGDAEVHEAVVKRGDLPGDKRVFAPVNCCALHKSCHENTKEVDEACADFLVFRYGLFLVQKYLIELKMKVYPARAREILDRR